MVFLRPDASIMNVEDIPPVNVASLVKTKYKKFVHCSLQYSQNIEASLLISNREFKDRTYVKHMSYITLPRP